MCVTVPVGIFLDSIGASRRNQTLWKAVDFSIFWQECRPASVASAPRHLLIKDIKVGNPSTPHRLSCPCCFERRVGTFRCQHPKYRPVLAVGGRGRLPISITCPLFTRYAQRSRCRCNRQSRSPRLSTAVQGPSVFWGGTAALGEDSCSMVPVPTK